MIQNSITDIEIENYLDQWFQGEKFSGGLDNLKLALKSLQIELPQSKVITIAGTNGKGETSFWVELILKNKTTMLWTSPHIIAVKERIRINQTPIDSEILKDLLLKTKQDLDHLKLQVSYYELIFIVFVKYANIIKPELLILEVGLGGRLDAVNLFDADLVLIPSISRDHMNILGYRLEQIALEKWGVVRKKSIVLANLELKYIDEIYQQRALKDGLIYKNVYQKNLNFSDGNKNLAITGLKTFLKWNINEDDLKYNPDQRGRNISNPFFQFYGSHNCDGIRKLVHFLCSKNYTKPIDNIVFSFSERSDAEIIAMVKMLQQLKGKCNNLFLTEFDHPKAMKNLKRFKTNKIEWVDWKNLINDPNKKNQHFLFLGSYYFIGTVQRFCQGTSVRS